MRILFVTDHAYLPHRVGGAESSTHDLALTLKEMGIEVAVLAAMPVAHSRFADQLLRRVLGRDGISEDAEMGYPVFRDRAPAQAAAQMLERFGPSVAVVTSGSYAPLAEAFLAVGTPTIVYLRDVEIADIRGVLPRGPGVRYVSNSRFNATRWAAVGGVKSVVIPPLVRPERFRTATTRNCVLFVNPVPKKGVELAFRLAQDRSDISFEFVECWPLSKHARRRLLAQVSATPNVAWRPAQTDPRHLYCNARVLLVPSMWEESWGRVVTEAHCSGIPALASNRGGLPESVGPGGILVAYDAPFDHWRAALSLMWDDQQKYGDLVIAAQRHARRSEIQPTTLANKFLRVVAEHVAPRLPRRDGGRPHCALEG